MTKVSKNAKLVTSLVLLVLAFLCSLGVSYSYFTASASAGNSLTFPDLNVRFIYDNAGTTYESFTSVDLYPVGGTISRGKTFELSTTSTGSAIDYLSIRNMENSCSAYVRFWIDAYLVENSVVDTTVNYGEYFSFVEYEGVYERGGTGANVDKDENWCYFVVNALDAYPDENDNDTITIGNTLTLSADAPAEMLGSQIKITLSLEAVQEANGAYTTVFNDAKGYYSGWAEEE